MNRAFEDRIYTVLDGLIYIGVLLRFMASKIANKQDIPIQFDAEDIQVHHPSQRPGESLILTDLPIVLKQVTADALADVVHEAWKPKPSAVIYRIRMTRHTDARSAITTKGFTRLLTHPFQGGKSEKYVITQTGMAFQLLIKLGAVEGLPSSTSWPILQTHSGM